MKLIMETFRKHIKEGYEEDRYYGENFVDFKEDVLLGYNVVESAKRYFGNPIGVGSTRLVFDMGGDFVLKTINIPSDGNFDPNSLDKRGFNLAHKAKSNEFEKDLKIQQNFPNVFSRAYESAEDFSWLIAEKVKPFKTHEAFLRYLEYHGPFPKDEFIPSRELAYKFVKEELDEVDHAFDTQYLKESTEESSYFDSRNFDPNFDPFADDSEEESHTGAMAPKKDNSIPKKFNIPTYALPVKTQMAKAMVDNPQVKSIIRAAVMLGIPARELKGPNFGESNITKRLVMLDMSLWD